MNEIGIRNEVIAVGKDMYDHDLTSVIGGNISMRSKRGMIITPSGAGVRWHWTLESEDLLEIDFVDGKVINGTNKPSRDILMHLAIYRQVPIANAVIHAHPNYVLAYVVAGKPILPATEMAEKALGKVTVVKWARGGTSECASYVAEEIVKRQDALEKHGIGVIIPKHGLVTVGKDLVEAYDALGRTVENAQAQIHMKLI